MSFIINNHYKEKKIFLKIIKNKKHKIISIKENFKYFFQLYSFHFIILSFYHFIDNSRKLGKISLLYKSISFSYSSKLILFTYFSSILEP